MAHQPAHADILEAYTPESRYLTDFRVDEEGVGHATFEMPPCEYLNTRMEHIGAAELQVCLNQMGFCFLLDRGDLEEFAQVSTMDGDTFRQWLTDHVIIAKQEVTFRKPISRSRPFEGTIKFIRKHVIGGNYNVDVEFQLGDDAWKGTALVAMTR